MTAAQVITAAIALIIKAAVLAARWAGVLRRRALESAACGADDAKDKEILFLRDHVEQLQSHVEILQKQLRKPGTKPRYTIRERLAVMFHLEYFQIPRRQVTACFGIARSTLYRWLHNVQGGDGERGAAHNESPGDIVALVWEIACANVAWGRVRIANQLAVLGVFVAPSTVRRILNRAKPPPMEPQQAAATAASLRSTGRRIPAFYPNHVWSIDLTTVLRWGLWPTYICVVIDHYSRKVVFARPLEGPNAAWVCDVLEETFRAAGPPKHIISDQGGAFISAAFAEIMKSWNAKHRFGAVGRHGSIAVTERVIRTMKDEWLRRAALIRGFHHLATLCETFCCWYSEWRPHATLGGQRPADAYCRDMPESVPHDAKVVPLNIERRRFQEARVTGFRLRSAA